MTTIVWFRRDLRLYDNPALSAAITLNEPVLPVYILATDAQQSCTPGAASSWYLEQSLDSLDQDIRKHGNQLSYRIGATLECLLQLVKVSKATRIYWNRVYEPDIIDRDSELKNALSGEGIEVKIFQDQSLLTPGKVLNQSGQSYKVFTAYWKQLSSLLLHNALFHPDDLPVYIKAPEQPIPTQSLAQIEICKPAHWHKKLNAHWQPGEVQAQNKLRDICEKLAAYPSERDIPAIEATSSLSPALHFGEISAKNIFETLRPYWQNEFGSEVATGASAFVRQLGWREFAINLLLDNPQTSEHSLKPEYDQSGLWSENTELIEIWQQGKTGYALVDAGMRELWETGIMHNRVRMVTASFLTKNLGQHWIHGARWFWDTLVDADLANNTMGWQWVAGCGCDASPFYRIFNPERQADRFDPEAQYINRWLGKQNSNTKLVDLAASRNAALERYQLVKQILHNSI